VSKSGKQNKKMIVVKNPIIPETKAEVKIPRAAVTLQLNDNKGHRRAGMGLYVLSVMSFFCNMTRSIKAYDR
jgi:hypothetical protein